MKTEFPGKRDEPLVVFEHIGVHFKQIAAVLFPDGLCALEQVAQHGLVVKIADRPARRIEQAAAEQRHLADQN